jgi:hypothetical protein
LKYPAHWITKNKFSTRKNILSKVNGKVEGEVGDFGVEASFSVDKKFSSSQKYEECSQARSSEQTTT